MNPSDYSVVADMLAKFQSSPEWIKALWLVAVPATLVGMTYGVADLAKAILVALAARRSDPSRSAPAWFDGETGGLLIRSADGEVRVLRLPTPERDRMNANAESDERKRLPTATG
jgi:hypothetical protein